MMLGTGFHLTWQKLLQLTVALSLLLIFTRCSDKPESIGANLLPEGDDIGVFDDTLLVELMTVPGVGLHDDVNDDQSLLGAIHNSTTGEISADFITNLIYTETPSYASADPATIDVLHLEIELVYSNIEGERGDLSFTVYELEEPVPGYDSTHFVLLDHMIGDSVGHLTSSNDESCLITLSPEFADRFITELSVNADLYESDNYEAFQALFKGLYFKSTPQSAGSGAIIRVDHAESRMRIVTSVSGAEADTNEFTLGYSNSELDEGGVHLNLFNHNPSAQVMAALNNSQVTDLSYLTAPGGTRILLTIPDFDAFKGEMFGRISINRAELVLPFSEGSGSGNIQLADHLGLRGAELNKPILDDSYSDYLGGDIDSDNMQYVLNVGNHYQVILTEEVDEEEIYSKSDSLYLFIADKSAELSIGGTDIEQLILNGSSSQKYPYLRIVYSKIP